jgi:predicted Zn-dependent protease
MGVGYIISLTVGIAIDGFDMLEGLESTLEMSSVLFILRYSRSFESEADSLAITRLHNAHIKVGPLDTLLTRISPKPRSRDRILELFSTHPFTKERTEKFQNARVLETFSPDTIFSFERAHWNEIKKGCPAPYDSTPLWKKILR